MAPRRVKSKAASRKGYGAQTAQQCNTIRLQSIDPWNTSFDTSSGTLLPLCLCMMCLFTTYIICVCRYKWKEKDINCVTFSSGFNPVWEETLSFTLHMAEVVLVRFLVWDHDPIGRDFIGQRTVAFSSLMPGMHWRPRFLSSFFFLFKIIFLVFNPSSWIWVKS